MRLTQIVHARLADHLNEGDLAIDATAGNGHDTRYLAEKVGAGGRVVAIDIQEAAIASTRTRLQAAGLADRVELVHAGHGAQLAARLKTDAGEVAAVLFNLGYLPGGDHSITTGAADTQGALQSARALLRPGGLLCVTAYCGHPGGPEEAAAVEAWMLRSAEQGDSVKQHRPEATNHPPVLWVLRRGVEG
jgi:SAM-dependent methyltransferase